MNRNVQSIVVTGNVSRHKHKIIPASTAAIIKPATQPPVIQHMNTIASHTQTNSLDSKIFAAFSSLKNDLILSMLSLFCVFNNISIITYQPIKSRLRRGIKNPDAEKEITEFFQNKPRKSLTSRVLYYRIVVLSR